jgi:transposase
VKQERFEWQADNPFYTKRFAMYIGRRCRESTVIAIAKEYRLDWKTTKDLDMEYMREQLRRAGQPAPRAIGIDELSIRKGHTYRIIVSDLDRKRAIWVGEKDRSEESMDKFYEWLGPKKVRRLRLAVMDMWTPFRNSLKRNAPQARIIYDKFHIMKHLGDAMNEVRKAEQARMTDKDRRFIKGQKFTLLAREENLSKEGRKNLRLLLRANKRINTAYILKESFEQLWSYKTEGWARRFFENWQDSLKWQRLKPYERFAAMIDRHWEGIVSYCNAENKVPLGYVEGFNNKVRVPQRRAYGLCDEEYLRLKIMTCMLPEL